MKKGGGTKLNHFPPSVAWKRRMDERLAQPGKPARNISIGMLVKMLPFLVRMQRMLKKSAAAGAAISGAG